MATSTFSSIISKPPIDYNIDINCSQIETGLRCLHGEEEAAARSAGVFPQAGSEGRQDWWETFASDDDFRAALRSCKESVGCGRHCAKGEKASAKRQS